jgi:copper chaperone NosL
VTWRLTAMEPPKDATHGFCIGGYNVNLSHRARRVHRVQFVADKPGTYPFYCTEFCSALHLEMMGYLHIKPKNAPQGRRERRQARDHRQRRKPPRVRAERAKVRPALLSEHPDSSTEVRHVRLPHPQLIGPRMPDEELRANRARYLTPTVIFMAARVLLLVSIFFPYWHMELEAPQYPNGLFLTAYVNHLTGDVKEIDGLNHYIGMRPLGEAASFERAASVYLMIAMFLLVEGRRSFTASGPCSWPYPSSDFPSVPRRSLLLDENFGLNLNPEAPLSSSVKPFVPTVLGEGGIGQFKTYAELGTGYWLAVVSGALIIVGFYFHRRAYRPLTLSATQNLKAAE